MLLALTILLPLAAPAPDSLQLLHFDAPSRIFISSHSDAGPAADLYDALAAVTPAQMRHGPQLRAADGTFSADCTAGRYSFGTRLDSPDALLSVGINTLGAGTWVVVFRGSNARQLYAALAAGKPEADRQSSPRGYVTCYRQHDAAGAEPVCAIGNGH